MINRQLENDINSFKQNESNIKSITKGTTSGASIEVAYSEPVSISSYTYYGKNKERDSDFTELSSIIKING